ncbi:MAG: glycine--tRNA ligase, partial [Deltaproteobacteria bacterium]|nr:glycine--tRNA ligase [Deltaproteobacteria bacterium]
MDKIVNLAKRRGFTFQSSEIYGGLNSCWDYGPLGVELKRNVKNAWWRDMVQTRDDIVGIDCSILMHPKVWEASGHLAGFTDPLVDCRVCKGRFRADHIADAQCPMKPSKAPGQFEKCDLTEARNFNLMFKTFMGPVEESAAVVYMRPETAQGIFVNFKNVQTTARTKIPFGIAQIGKSFRNEITPGNFLFRTREFEQMEMEFFVKPGDDDRWFEYWTATRRDWYVALGIRPEKLRL